MQYLAQQIKWCSLAVMLSMTFSHATWAQQSAPHPAHKLYKVYDTFSGNLIDPSRWRSNPHPCGMGNALECVREIEAGRLHMRVRNYGGTDTDDGGLFAALGLDAIAAWGATDFATGVVVRKTSAQGCPNVDTFGWVGLAARYFNGGQLTEADDFSVQLEIQRLSSDLPGVFAVAAYTIYQGQTSDAVHVGEVRLGERVILGLAWDKANHRIIARLIRPDHHTSAEQYLPYTIPDSIPPVTPMRMLFLATSTPNCLGTKSFLEMDALFDNVTVGQ